MKPAIFAVSMLSLTTLSPAALAQTNLAAAPKAAAPKAAAPKAATKAKAAPNLLDPSTLNAKVPPVYLVKLNTTKGPHRHPRDQGLGALIGADRFYNLVRAGVL